MTIHRFQIVVFLIALGTVVTGCGAPPTPKAELEPVRLQLAWIPNSEYAPFYVAEHNGFFAQEGLKVEFINGGFDEKGQPIDQLVKVANNEADFGIATADRFLVARSKGAHLVAVATLYQRSPIAFISLAEKNITKPQDFVGKKVFVDVTGSIAYTAMMSSLNIDRTQIHEIPRDDFTIEPLISGRVDVVSAFINDQPVQLKQKGYKVNTILASDYGIDVYANVIFTTEDMIAKNPDLVRGFLRASLKGIDTTVEDPKKAAEITVGQSKELNLETEMLSMEQALPLFKPAGAQAGMMTDDAWKYTANTMIEQGLLPSDISAQGAYTLQFLNEIYVNAKE